MKADTQNIDRAALIRAVEHRYGTPIQSLSFLPVGLESYCYSAIDEGGRRYLIRVGDLSHSPDPGRKLAASRALANLPGLAGVAAPLPTLDGAIDVPLGRFSLSIFEWIEGQTQEEGGLTDADLAVLARLLASIHGIDTALLPTLDRETYDFHRRDDLLQVVREARVGKIAGNRWQRKMRSALRDHGDEILTTLDTLDRLGSEARKRQHKFVVTHGDPTQGNVMKDSHGSIHLVDWIDLALGPAERDLVYFTTDRFEPFHREYATTFGPVRLHLDLFAFYEYRWILQEIADYGSRILFGENQPEENEYYWEDFIQYLPVPHRRVGSTLREIVTVAERVLGQDAVIGQINERDLLPPWESPNPR